MGLIIALLFMGIFGGIAYSLFNQSQQRHRRGSGLDQGDDDGATSLDDDDSGETDLIADRLGRTADRFSNAGDLTHAAQATALALAVKSMEGAAARQVERDFMHEVGGSTSGGTDDWASSSASSSHTGDAADLLSGSDAGSTDNS